MLALIDADIVGYRCAASAEKESESWIAVARTKELIEQILHDVGATAYKLFLSGDKNFRKDIYPLYKANRTQPKPKFLVACKQYMVDHWGAKVTDGIEADDALGIAQTKWPEDKHNPEYKGQFASIICSIDKDLLMIPGKHYNFVKKEFHEVDEAQAQRTFYTSMLVGDAADNIKGVPGIGKKKAPMYLDGCETEQELCDIVFSMYNDPNEFYLNADLLWIWRKENDRWTLNRGKSLRQEVEISLESTPLTVEADESFMVLSGTK
jgi:5'-3' exonuclease